MQQAELKRIFLKVDTANKGAINKDQFELLIMALGQNLSPREIDACLSDLGVPVGGTVPFDLFFEWWTSDVGMSARITTPLAAPPKSAGGH